MNFVIPTIQHTGTKFVARMFPDYWYASLNEDPDEKAIHVGHISNGQIKSIIKLLEIYPAIIPLRHPYLVAESWKRRGKNEGELVNNWRLLVNEIDKYKPYYLVIDSDDRKTHLDAINSELELDLKTDWNPVNVVSSTFDLRHQELDPSPALSGLTDEIDEFLNRFY